MASGAALPHAASTAHTASTEALRTSGLSIGAQASAREPPALVRREIGERRVCSAAMTLVDTLRQKALLAMKAKDPVRTTILRLAQSEVQATEARAGRALTEEEEFAVVRKLVKSNEETLAASPAGSPGDAEKRATLARENEILAELLPKALGAPEIQALLDGVKDAIRAAGNDGQATGVAMKHLKSVGASAGGADVAKAVKAIRA